MTIRFWVWSQSSRTVLSFGPLSRSKAAAGLRRFQMTPRLFWNGFGICPSSTSMSNVGMLTPA
jgi:hypothetical protein